MPEKPQTKPAAKPAAARRNTLHGPYSGSVKQTLSQLAIAIQVAVPSIVDTDEIFRRWIVRYLLDHYRSEVLREIAAGMKKLGGKHA